MSGSNETKSSNGHIFVPQQKTFHFHLHARADLEIDINWLITLINANSLPFDHIHSFTANILQDMVSYFAVLIGDT